MTASVWGDGTPNEAVEIAPADIIKEQSGNYTILEADAHKVIDYIGTGGHTFTLPASLDVGNGFSFTVRNKGSGTVTIAPVGADTVNGAASLVLATTSVSVFLVKSADFGVIYGQSIALAASAITNTPAGSIAATTVQAAINELDTEKAAVAGNAANVFKVATAVAAEDAIPLAQGVALFPSATGLISQLHTAFTTTGTSTAFILTPTQVQTAYAAGQRFRVKFSLTAGVAPTINVSGLGAKALKLYNSAGVKVAASATSIIANILTDIEYDGVDFVILDPLPGSGALIADSQVFTVTGTWTKPTNLNGNEVFLIELFGSGGPGGNGGGGGGFGGAGGAGGGYKSLRKLASELGATEVVTVGLGGVAPSGTGGTTSFGSHLSILGGGPGDGYPSAPPTFGGVAATVASQAGNTPAIGSVGGTAGADYESAVGGTGALHSTTHGGGGGGCAAGGGAGGAGGVDGGAGVVGVVPGGGGGGGGATSGVGANGARGEIRVRLLAG